MEKPILFNTAMVQAILEGKKTCTRRIIKNKYDNADITFFENKYGKRLVYMQNDTKGIINDDGSKSCQIKACEEVRKPYQVGDILYVRETWLKADDKQYYYRADETPVSKEAREDFGYKWKPSIHMPKEAARIFLEVTDVRVERLNDIDDEGAKAEGSNTGIGIAEKMREGAIDRFKRIWNSTINKKDIDKYDWDSNPWVWVIEFKVKEVKR